VGSERNRNREFQVYGLARSISGDQGREPALDIPLSIPVDEERCQSLVATEIQHLFDPDPIFLGNLDGLGRKACPTCVVALFSIFSPCGGDRAACVSGYCAKRRG
jgi:hypothetical protein